MSGVFGTAKKPKMSQFPNREHEPVETVTEDATEAGRRKRKHLTGSQTTTKISGIRSALQSALKKRLGE